MGKMAARKMARFEAAVLAWGSNRQCRGAVWGTGYWPLGHGVVATSNSAAVVSLAVKLNMATTTDIVWEYY